MYLVNQNYFHWVNNTQIFMGCSCELNNKSIPEVLRPVHCRYYVVHSMTTETQLDILLKYINVLYCWSITFKTDWIAKKFEFSITLFQPVSPHCRYNWWNMNVTSHEKLLSLITASIFSSRINNKSPLYSLLLKTNNLKEHGNPYYSIFRFDIWHTSYLLN